MFSKFYDGTIRFTRNGSTARASFISWPIEIEHINRKIALGQPLTNHDVHQLIDLLDSSITREYLADDLASQFTVCPSTAETLAKYVFKFQYTRDKICQLPSMVTLIKSCKNELDLSQKILLEFIKERIMGLNDWELELDTAVWLNNLQEEDGFCIRRDQSVVTVLIPGLDELKFDFDSEVSYLMRENSLTLFEALYHQAVTTSSGSLNPILKCSRLRCSFIKAFSPMHLLGLKSNTTTHLICDNQKDVVKLIKRESPQLPESIDVDYCYQDSHKAVGVLEALTRFDPCLSFVTSNVRPVFANTSVKRTKKFKRVENHDMRRHFYNKDDGKWYEVFQVIIRLNKIGFILCHSHIELRLISAV